jgi:hypothetical protein
LQRFNVGVSAQLGARAEEVEMEIRRLAVRGAMAFILLLGLAGATSAQVNRPFTGQWFQNRGPLVDIPINGGPVPCNGFAPGAVRSGCIGNLRPVSGGVPNTASAYVIDNGGSPASFTVPPFVFKQNAGTQSVPVQGVPTVVRLTTTLSLNAPGTTSPNGLPPGSRKFLKNAPTQDPGQALRAAANFNWCPGAPGNPTCPASITLFGTTVGGFPNGQCFRPGVNCIPLTPGGYTTGGSVPIRAKPPNYSYAGASFPALVRYKAGPNAFGGTMALLLSGPGVVTVKGGPLGTYGGVSLAARQPFGGTGFEAQGRGYSATDTDLLSSNPIYLGFNIPTPCTGMLGSPLMAGGMTVTTCDVITGTGPVVGAIPATTNLNVGFPWTTGTVYALVTGTVAGSPATTLLTAMGTDNRNALGSGYITLVAGGVANRALSGQQFSNLDVVTFHLPEPGATLLLGAGLAMLGVLYQVRRRL